MRYTLLAPALAAMVFAGHSSNPPTTSKGPGTLLTGCPNGYNDFVTGECKPFHLRVRDAATGGWQSHKVTDAYPVHDWDGHTRGDAEASHGPGKAGKSGNGKNGKHGGPAFGGQFGHGKPGGPSHHCPNGVAAHATGECKPFRVHARDAESGQWREHHVTGAYRIPDEGPGRGGHGGPPGGFAGGHSSPNANGHGGKGGPAAGHGGKNAGPPGKGGKGGMLGGGAGKGEKGGW